MSNIYLKYTLNLVLPFHTFSYNNPAAFENLHEIIEVGPKDIQYTNIVSYATDELRSLCNIDEKVNPISSPEDSISFLMELSSFLKELGLFSCSYNRLIF